MNDTTDPDLSLTSRSRPATIDVVFRNGSLTAISVVAGFSLSFLNRWAALPGSWHTIDLITVAFIVAGIILQLSALAGMLFVRSLLYPTYLREVRCFLAGLVLVAVGIALAISGDIFGFGQNTL